MKLAIEILAWFGALTLLTSAVLLLALWGAARDERRYTRRRLEAMERHPAGERLPANGCDGWTPRRTEPKRASCGAWIGTVADDYWAREFAAITHVNECRECQIATNRRHAA